MLKKVSTFLLVIWISPAFGQIKGKVISSDSTALPFVNAVLLNAQDSGIMRAVVSAEDGQFLFENIENGDFVIQLSMIGFKKWSSEVFKITAGQPTKNFGELLLTEEAILIDGVVVTAQKPQIEQTMEGTTLNVENSMINKGGTALQILERAPGVLLDHRNNDFTLNGKSGILFMINGRPVRMSANEIIAMLEGMSADNLKKVELLTNPSSRYDSDGGAGIINIVTIKNEEEGANGSISVSAGYGYGAKQAISLNGNYRKNSINYYGSYSFNYDHFFSSFHGLGIQTIPVLGGDADFDFKNNSERKRTSHNATAGLEKEFGNGLIIGGNLLYNNSIIKTDIYNNADYIFQDNSFLHADINVYGRSVQNNFNTSLFTEKRLKNDGKISFDADYIFYDNEAPTIANSLYRDEDGNITEPENDVYANSNRGESSTTIRIGVAKFDFTTKIGRRLKLETGIKGTYSNTANNAIIESLNDGNWSADERNRSNLEINEKIGASYLSFQLSIDSLTTLTAGLRYEYWLRDFSEQNLDKQFGKLFSSAFLTRTLSSTSSLQFAYNRRITRPDYNDLTNFLRYNDPTSVFTGTPKLQPAITDNLKLGYQFRNKNIALIYNYESNPIARFQIVENNRSNLVIIAPQNMDYLRTLGIQTHMSFKISNRWNFTVGGTLSQRSFKLSYTRVPVKKDYLAYNLYTTQNFSLPKSFSMELSGIYNSTQYSGSLEVKGYGSLNFGLKKEIPNNWGTVQFTITDLFQSTTIRWRYGALTEEAFNSRSTVRIEPESANSRIFRLSYSYNFGKTKAKARNQRQASSQEEKSRIGN